MEIKSRYLPFLIQISHPMNTIITGDSDVRFVPRHQQGLLQRIETCLGDLGSTLKDLHNTKEIAPRQNLLVFNHRFGLEVSEG